MFSERKQNRITEKCKAYALLFILKQRQINRQKYRKIDRMTDTYKDRKTDRHKDRKTNRYKDTNTVI